MEFQEVLKIKNRMCKEEKCNDCPLSTKNNPTHDVCERFLFTNPKQAEERIIKWAKEHPAKTRMNEVLEKYPNAKVYSDIGMRYLAICPKDLDYQYNQNIECNGMPCIECKIKYWNEEVK